MKSISFRKIVIAIVIVGIGAGYVRADKLQLQEKLSRDAKIQLNDVTIAEALEKIGQAAEVKIVLSDEALWKLPYGEATRLSVALTGPLADSLTEMLNTFFMRYAVGDNEITIYPRPELEHIIGRPTTKQLELLKRIYSRPIRVYFVEELQRTVNEALGEEVLISPVHVHAQLGNLLGQLVGKKGIYLPPHARTPDKPVVIKKAREPEPNEPELTECFLPTPVTLVQLLSQVVIERGPGNTRWYISGMDFPGQIPEILVVSAESFREAKLDQVVDISFEGKRADRADVILQRLAGWTGMELFVVKADPSWLEEIIAVNMQNIKLKQALRNIVSTVDGDVNIDFGGNYISIRGPIHPQKPAVPRRTKSSGDAGEGYVGKISIPMDGGKYFIEFMLRESDLTEELKKLREDKIKEIFKKVGKTGMLSK